MDTAKAIRIVEALRAHQAAPRRLLHDDEDDDGATRHAALDAALAVSLQHQDTLRERATQTVKDNDAAYLATASLGGPLQSLEEKRIEILRLQLSRLQSEVTLAKRNVEAPSPLEHFSDRVPNVHEPLITGELRALEKLQESVREHELARRISKDRIQNLEEEIALSKKLEEEALVIEQTLKGQLAEEKSKSTRTSHDILKSARRQTEEIQQKVVEMQTMLIDFIDQLEEDGQAPTVDSDDEETIPQERDAPRGIRHYFQRDTWKGKKSKSIEPCSKGQLLKVLLETLMNASVLKPEDPYVDVLSPPDQDQDSDLDLPSDSDQSNDSEGHHQFKSKVKHKHRLSLSSPSSSSSPSKTTFVGQKISKVRSQDIDVNFEKPTGLGMPPPLVHYLLRSGVAIEHPTNSNKVKLVDFARKLS